MICPECRAEYREGFTECSDCQIPLVSELAEAPKERDAQMVPIFTSSNPLQISLAKSMLLDADIEHAVMGDDLRYLLGAGGGGLAGNPTTGPARIIVRLEDKERAGKVLEELPEADEGLKSDDD